MVENSNNSGSGNGGGSNTGLAFIVGGVVVLLALVAWFVLAGGITAPGTRDVDVDISLPEMTAPTLPPVEPPSIPGPGPVN